MLIQTQDGGVKVTSEAPRVVIEPDPREHGDPHQIVVEYDPELGETRLLVNTECVWSTVAPAAAPKAGL